MAEAANPAIADSFNNKRRNNLRQSLPLPVGEAADLRGFGIISLMITCVVKNTAVLPLATMQAP
jgi:hypothetical protein